MEHDFTSRSVPMVRLRWVAVALVLATGLETGCRTSHYGHLVLEPHADYLAMSSDRTVDLANTDVIRLGRLTGQVAQGFGLRPVHGSGTVAAFESPPYPGEDSYPHLLVTVNGASDPAALIVTVIDFDNGGESEKASQLRAAITERVHGEFPMYELRYESRTVTTSFAP